jgi:hypothetical protein
VQAKGIRNIFNKIIAETFPNVEKRMPNQVQKASRIPNRKYQNRSSPQHIIVKTLSTKTKGGILKAAREKIQVTNNGKPMPKQQISKHKY